MLLRERIAVFGERAASSKQTNASLFLHQARDRGVPDTRNEDDLHCPVNNLVISKSV